MPGVNDMWIGTALDRSSEAWTWSKLVHNSIRVQSCGVFTAISLHVRLTCESLLAAKTAVEGVFASSSTNMKTMAKISDGRVVTPSVRAIERTRSSNKLMTSERRRDTRSTQLSAFRRGV